MNYSDKAREVIGLEIEGLRKVCQQLGQSFDDVIELMLQSLEQHHKIVVTGIGKSLNIAGTIAATFASTGATCVVLNPIQAMHGDMGVLDEGDALLALSYSGESEELVGIVPIARRIGVKIVSLTGRCNSSLARCSDVIIPVTVDREACPFNMAPTTSTTAMLAMGDALAMVLIDARGFEKDDYAKLHPGGAIGRALLLRVSDIMRTELRLARIGVNATVKQALIAMTGARAGSAGVVDADGKVAGIFTDGDLRRHIANDANLLDLAVETVMTPSPFTIRADQLAVDALKAFEEHNFDDLLVVDSDNRLVGAIDIQDLPKMKIM